MKTGSKIEKGNLKFHDNLIRLVPPECMYFRPNLLFCNVI